jgi:hypothetical protein
MIQLNLSPYIIQLINSFSDANSSQVTEQVLRMYAYAIKKGGIVTDLIIYTTNARVECQRTSLKPF